MINNHFWFLKEPFNEQFLGVKKMREIQTTFHFKDLFVDWKGSSWNQMPVNNFIFMTSIEWNKSCVNIPFVYEEIKSYICV